MNKDKNIIIVSNEPWGDIWFSKHHYAKELSHSNKVIFINPPAKWRISNLWKRRITEKKVDENLSVLNYHNFLPFFFMTFNNKVVSKRISQHLKKSKFSMDIFWSFDPQRLFIPSLFGAKKTIFHVVDKYQFKHPAELIFHQHVDGFILVSDEFVSQYLSYNRPQIVVPHGLSGDEFKIEANPNFNIDYSDFIVFIGNVDLRLDYQFIYKLGSKFPNEKFLFVGGIKTVDDIYFKKLFTDKELKNIIYLPPVHAKNVKYYIHAAKGCIAPMSTQLDGNMISHHKILQYMAHGKAVFCPVFSAYLPFDHLLYMDNSPERLLNKLNDFLTTGEKVELKTERIEIAQQHNYSHHLKTINNFIESL